MAQAEVTGSLETTGPLAVPQETPPPRRVKRRVLAVRTVDPFERPGAAAPTTELGGGDGYGEAAASNQNFELADPAPLYIEREVYRPPVLCDGLARTVRFDTGSATVRDEDLVGLSRLADRIACPNSNLVVAGFTDTTGSERTNINLSLARAESVIASLREPYAGMLLPQYANAYAEAYPIVPTADGVDEAANRRAEVFLGYRCPAAEEVVESLAPGEALGNLAATKPYIASGEGLTPIKVTLHRRELTGLVEPADADRLDAIVQGLVNDLGAPPTAIFPMVAGGACLAPGENERIDIEY